MEKIIKAPFFRLLLPLLLGIVIQYYYHIGMWSIMPLVLGLGIMLFSYFVRQSKTLVQQLWFGYGVYFVLFGIGIISTMSRQQVSAFTFPDVSEAYTVTIVDMPQEKPNSYAYKVKLKDSDKLIVCYFSKQDTLRDLNVGDTFTFFSQIEAFKNRGNPDEFNYARYMYNKGYSGVTFITSDRWQKEEKSDADLFILAVQSRQYILHLYQSLNLSPNEYGMLSALTLGYADALSDDIVESFRTTGVAHILAVSGMHVSIIFIAISFLFGFISRHSKYHWIKQVIIVFLLWAYVFMIGFPPSALRACIMLTVFSIALLARRKSYSYNTLFLTAFFMLLWNPFYLFDMGFQLSFLAVFSMLLLMPILSGVMPVKNKSVRYFRDIFNVSLSVQIGVFPLCLYYFGSFPVYFFAANLIIIPLVTLALYDALLIVFLKVVEAFMPFLDTYVSYFPIQLFKLLVKAVTSTSSFFEHLPYASLRNLKPSLFGLLLLWVIIVSLICFIRKRKAKSLIVSLVCTVILMGIGIRTIIENKDTLRVYNRPQSTQVVYQIGYCKEEVSDIRDNRLIWLNGSTYLLVAQDVWKGGVPNHKMKVDYLHLVAGDAMSLYSLGQVFEINKVILDGSLSKKTLQRFVSECEKLRIPYYDVSNNGVLRINF